MPAPPPSKPRRVRFVVRPEQRGTRLDRALAAGIAGLSRRQARVLLDLGGVYVDGVRVKIASRPVRAGQTIEAVFGGGFARATKAVGGRARRRDEAALPAFTVVHEDQDVVVVDKPAGLLSAPTSEGDHANLLALLRARTVAGPVFLVHRLDFQTSGLLVFARTPAANRVLAEAWRRHDVRREYLALVGGAPAADAFTLDAAVAGRPARTHVTVVERIATVAAMVRCRLETGRTHQIRIHLHGAGFSGATPGACAPARVARGAARLPPPSHRRLARLRACVAGRTHRLPRRPAFGYTRRVASGKRTIYKIAFLNEGKVFEIYARRVAQSSLLGFVEVEGLLFGERSSVVVDPTEEKLRVEFAGVERTMIPIHAVVRIDQ